MTKKNNTILLCGIVLLLIIVSCKNPVHNASLERAEVIIENERMLLGEIFNSDLRQSYYQSWFDSTYANYNPNDSILNQLSKYSDSLTIKCVMGTWCSDSRREVPAFLKILDLIKYDTNRLELVATDRSKDNPTELLVGLNIEYVPTIIVYQNRQEIGRIIESPNKSLEEDLFDIFNE